MKNHIKMKGPSVTIRSQKRLCRMIGWKLAISGATIEQRAKNALGAFFEDHY